MTTLLVDGNNVFARADFASKGKHTEMSVDGVNTSALLIFINMISKYVKQVKPTRMMVCWDSGHGLRDSIYPQYKASRVKPPSNHDGPTVIDLNVEQHDPAVVLRIAQQMAEREPELLTPRRQAMEFCTWAAIPHTSKPQWEADDLIAVYAKNTPGPKVILTGDKDLLQLIGPETKVIRPGGSNSESWDEARFSEEYGFPADQLPLYMALVGDTSDGVPGVRGIGPKKAVKMLEEASWVWETLLTDLGPEKAKEAILARRLVDLINPEFAAYADDIAYLAMNRPTPEVTLCKPGHIMFGPMEAFLDKWEMRSVSQRLRDGTLWENDPAEPTDGNAREAFSGFDL